MSIRYSRNFAEMKPSAIREILKHTSGTDVIPFAAGNPSVDAFPVEDIARITEEILRRPPATYLQYGISEGYAPLRNFLKEDLTTKGIKFETDDLIIVSGAQQGIDISAQVLCDAGDTIVCEDPSFIGALNAFRSHGIKLAGVPMENDGMDMSALEKTLAGCDTVRMIYTIPNFQNPCGISMSWEKRVALYALACKYNVIILEDNPYGELRFAGEDIPNIKSIDTEGRVIYCGSFSKLLAPGMRVGYLLANADLIAKLTVAKQCTDVHTNLMAQITVHEFISKCDMAAHIAKLRSIYRHKYTLMAKGLAANVPDKIEFTKPEGGLFVLGYMPQGTDVAAFCKACIEKKLAVVPGSAFCADPGSVSYTVRLNYSTPSDEQIVEGCRIFGAVAKETLRAK